MRRFGTSVATITAAAVLTLVTAASSGCDGDGDASRTAAQTGTVGDAGNAGEGQTAPPASGGSAPADLVTRGERIYNVNCIACHHRDPSRDGGLGPPIAGASFELLEARVLRAAYPPGYAPKSDTRLMVPLPHLEPEIEALTAFLAAE